MAVEIFRGPDHMAMRMLTAETVRRQGRVCNGVEDNAFHLCLGGSASPKTMSAAAGAVLN
jgi:hypothetical protein